MGRSTVIWVLQNIHCFVYILDIYWNNIALLWFSVYILPWLFYISLDIKDEELGSDSGCASEYKCENTSCMIKCKCLILIFVCRSFDVLFGNCPYCSESITVKTEVLKYSKLKALWFLFFRIFSLCRKMMILHLKRNWRGMLSFCQLFYFCFQPKSERIPIWAGIWVLVNDRWLCSETYLSL